MALFAELRTRKVYRVAVAYAVASWAIIQFGDIVFPVWNMPAWTMRLVIALVLAGFPIALIFAWIFDVTPEGLRATAPVLAAREERPHRTRRNIAILLLASVGISAAAGLFLLPRASAGRVEKSIAILPFENFSEEKENAHFADGIQDDLLTSLSKIGDLKVISRTSVMAYRGRTHNIRQIGNELGVATVLEGSVRRAGNRVRVNVQLINAETDEHIWSEIYDRELTDVFSIQSELAQKIAWELRAKLSPEEKVQVSRKPTETARRISLSSKRRTCIRRCRITRSCCKRSDFTNARCSSIRTSRSPSRGSLICTAGCTRRRQNTRAPAACARVGAARGCLAAGPAGSTPRARLLLLLRRSRLHARAGGVRDRAARFAERRQRAHGDCGDSASAGQLAERTANFEKALQLSPKDTWVMQNLALTYEATRNYSAADTLYREAIKLAPDALQPHTLLARLQISWKGDIAAAESVLSQVPPKAQAEREILMAWVNARVLQRRWDDALALLDQMPRAGSAEETESMLLHDAELSFRGMLHHEKGETEIARTFLEQARQQLQQKIAAAPDYAKLHGSLGQVLAYLGDKPAAIAAAERAMQLLPTSVDAFDGPMMTIMVAQTFALVGENDRALALIDQLLTTPNGLSVPTVRLDPIWDKLRDDPRLEQTLAKYAERS